MINLPLKQIWRIEITLEIKALTVMILFLNLKMFSLSLLQTLDNLSSSIHRMRPLYKVKMTINLAMDNYKKTVTKVKNLKRKIRINR